MDMGNHAVVRVFHLTCRAAAGIIIAIGCIGLLGWMAGSEHLKALMGRDVSMKTNTAICLILAGSALLILARPDRPARPKRLAYAMSIIVAIVGGMTLTQHVAGINFGIDELLFAEAPGAFATASPNRMGPPASTSFLLSGLALLLLNVRTLSGRVPSQSLALVVGLIALLPLIGYAYSIQSLYGISKYTGIAPHTAVAIFVLAIGLLAARPTTGVMAVVCADDAGGMMARRLIIPAILIPFVLGWLRTVGQRRGWYDEGFGRPSLIIALIISFTTLVWWTARAVSLLGQQRLRAEDERERSEMALRLSEARSRQLASVVQNSPDFIGISDIAGVPVFVNDAATKLVGSTCERMLQTPVADYFVPEERAFIRDVVLPTVLKQGRWSGELTFRHHATEARIPVLYTVFRIDDPVTGKPVSFATITRDITEQKRSEAMLRETEVTLRRAKDEAERASEAKSDFLATLSHELRTPLTPVLLTVSLMESHPALPPELREDIETIRRNVELESRLISDLLDLTRITKGKLQLDEREVDLHLIIRSAIDICQREASAKLNVDLSAKHRTVLGDSTRLQQIFWNLINNAMKFTPAEGTITIRSREVDGRVRVEVADTGAGIDPAVLPKLFNAFEQGEVRAARQQAGLGLGLAISKKLTEAHGGTIEALSDGRGRGATFAVELPVVDRFVRVPAATPSSPAKIGSSSQALNVLLIEDHEPTLRVMERLLRQIGHRVTGVSSVASGTAAAQRDGFDLIISDLGLPDGSGLDVMRQVRERYAGRAIALTGYGMDSDIDASRDAGFAEHLTKPVDIGALDAAIARVMRNR